MYRQCDSYAFCFWLLCCFLHSLMFMFWMRLNRVVGFDIAGVHWGPRFSVKLYFFYLIYLFIFIFELSNQIQGIFFSRLVKQIRRCVIVHYSSFFF